MAGTDLHRQIILNTRTDGTDQDHIDVVHLSYASRISDRTKFLLHTVEDHPGLAMADVIIGGAEFVARQGQKAVAGVPCNTFHAPEIFQPYREELQRRSPETDVAHMLEETARYLKEHVPGIRNIGLLSTTGTRNSRVWHTQMEQYGITITEIPEELQPRLHENIYHPLWGIKALSKAGERVRTDFDSFCQMLLEEKVQAILLGCTELPMIFPVPEYLGVPLIDPMVPLARSLVRMASPNQLLPLA